MAELRATLSDWLDSVVKCDEGRSDEDTEEFGGLIAFYLID